MSQPLPLHAHNRLVNSAFGLLGTDENALSFALGYTFQQCVPLLQWFLKEVGVAGVYRSSLQHARVDLQRGATGQGITDIEIHHPGHFHVIVEAKVGLAVPTIDQCRKYLPRFRTTKEPIQKLVAVVQSPDQTFVRDYGQRDKQLSKRLVRFIWPRLVPECIRLMMGSSLSPAEREWIRCFYSFLDQEYGMKAFTTEVWILAISTGALWPNGMSHWDIHQKYRLWWDYKEHSVRPLYIAFRVDGVLDSIYRVSRVEHAVPIIDRVPELRKCTKYDFAQPATIWHFGPPVPLAKPLRTGGGMYNRRVRCDLDLLLMCSSVQEIEVEMGKRRQEPEERVGTPRPGVLEVRLADLNPLHPIPRPGMPPNHISDLANTIRTNGYDVSRAIPVVRMPDGRLVQLGGHHRAAAMGQLGETTIPARVADWNSLSPGAQARWRQRFPNFSWDDFIK